MISGALRGKARLDRLGGSARVFWEPLRSLARRLPTRSLRVLDLGGSAGAGAVRLWKFAARSGLKITVDGCEPLGAGYELARRQALSVGAPIHFHRIDPVRDELPEGYDVITCSLLLHNVDDAGAIQLLRRMNAAARELVLVHDLVRCNAGLRFARWSSRWFQNSEVVRSDAESALRSAFTVSEAVNVALKAGVKHARVEPRWPYPFLLSWRPPTASVERQVVMRPGSSVHSHYERTTGVHPPRD